MSRVDQSVPDDQRAVLIGLLKALEPFHKLNPNMPLQYGKNTSSTAVANENLTVVSLNMAKEARLDRIAKRGLLYLILLGLAWSVLFWGGYFVVKRLAS